MKYSIAPYANLRKADLRKANLRGADLRGADLRRADLQGADLRGANLWRADLRKANLRKANLRGANLRKANLRGADLRQTTLAKADLRGADLDLSALPFNCGSFDIIVDDRLFAQLMCHISRLVLIDSNRTYCELQEHIRLIAGNDFCFYRLDVGRRCYATINKI